MKKRTLKFKRDVVGTLSPSQLAKVTGGLTFTGWCHTQDEGCTNTQQTCGACSSEGSGTGCP